MGWPTVWYTNGMRCGREYAWVLLSTLLDLCGVDRTAGQYVLAEGADGSSMTRTIPMDRAMDDVMVAWAMNGEMLRPENGYPLRLVVPGVQGVSWVKYLRRIEVGDQPYHTKDEVIHYVDLMPDVMHRQFPSIQECNRPASINHPARPTILRVDSNVVAYTFERMTNIIPIRWC